MKSYDKLFIGGNWTAPASTRTIEVINPTTEEVCGSVPEAVEADIDAAVAAAREAFDQGPWPRMTPVERAADRVQGLRSDQGGARARWLSSSPPRWDLRSAGG